MPRGTELGLGPAHIVLDGYPVLLPPRKGHSSSQFSVHVCCNQTAGLIKIRVGVGAVKSRGIPRDSRGIGIIFGATVCKTVRPILSVRCLSVLSICLSAQSVTFVHCGQTVGRMKMKLGAQLGLGPDHIVLDGDPAPLPRGSQPPPSFRPISVSAKWLHGSRFHLVCSYASAQATLC